MKSEIVIEGVN